MTFAIVYPISITMMAYASGYWHYCCLNNSFIPRVVSCYLIKTGHLGFHDDQDFHQITPYTDTSNHPLISIIIIMIIIIWIYIVPFPPGAQRCFTMIKYRLHANRGMMIVLTGTRSTDTRLVTLRCLTAATCPYKIDRLSASKVKCHEGSRSPVMICTHICVPFAMFRPHAMQTQ